MNTQENTRSFIPNSPAVDTALNLGRKALALALAWLMVPLGIGDLYAQTAPPPPPDQGQYQQGQAPPPPDQGQYQDQSGNYDQGPPPQAYNPLSPDQLGQLVAPIALYPDALVAQILAASTYPTEVADADNFLRANQGLPPEQLGGMVNQMDWDPSVKALIAFPSVLYNLDRNLDWTSQLGNAYYNQPQDVMNAIQDMRARAYAAGNLRSSSQLAVEYQPNNIIIAPVNPDVYYVPWYNPWVVYGAPVVAWGGYYSPPRPVGYYVAVGVAIGFGFGIAVASWNNWGWGCHHWGMGWRDHAVVYQRNVYVSRSRHVVNHGYYGRYDRNVAARNYNRNLERRAPNYHPVDNRRPTNFNRQPQQYNRDRNFNQQQQQQNRQQNLNRQQNRPNTYNRPENNVRQNRNTNLPPQQNRNQNLNRPQNSPNTYNRPENNVRQNRNTNLPPQQQPQQYKQPQQQNRQQNVYRPPQQNQQQNYNRQQQNYNRPPQQNRQQNVYRPPQQNREQNYNRQQQNYNRPPQQNRPVQQPRPQQSQPQARPQPRPQQQPHPQQSRPENRGQSQKKDSGHRR